MDNTSLLQMSHEFVRELHLAEERFLEVLLPAFDITRRKSPERGFDLQVSFNEETRSIWDRNGIRYLRKEVLSEDKRKEHQAKLDTFLYRDGAGMLTPDDYGFSDKHFVFRFASGGTLPVVSFLDDPAEKKYYILTYREVDPIGWNIINGGSDNRDELMDPEQTIKRELHEELIIVDPKRKLRYEFPSENGKARDLPAHAIARKLLDRLLPHKCLKDLSVADVDMEWIDGPDSVHIRMGDDAPVTRSGFFLNINGLDFGIELDKIARIKIPKNAVMFFGETDRGHLLNCPIGLFDVNRFSPDREPEALQREAFRPDLFYFNGKLHRHGEIDGVLAGDFIDQLRKHLWTEELAKFESCLDDEARYALCPVTARIILRHRRWEAEQKPGGHTNDSNLTEEGSGEGYLVADKYWVSSDYQRVVTDADKDKTWFVEPFTRMVLKVLLEDTKPAGLTSMKICEKATHYYEALAADEKTKGNELPPPPKVKSLGQYFRVKVAKKKADKKTDKNKKIIEEKVHPIFRAITKFEGRTPQYSLKGIKVAHMRQT